jgi:hypothetical protein
VGEQIALCFEQSVVNQGPCVFTATPPADYDGPHHCPACAAEVERSCDAFDAAVAAGKYNRRGYTLAEWKRSGRAAETWREAAR